MGFDIPMRTKNALDRNSLANKRGLMNVRGSFDKKSLNNNAFVARQTAPPQPKTTAPPPTVQATPPPRPVKKQRSTAKIGAVLQKGQKVAVDDSGKIKIALGWDILDSRCEIDASAFMLGADNRVISDDWFIFYGQDKSPDGSVSYSKGGKFDDAVIDIDFRKINPSVQKIVFSVTIYEAMERRLNFGMTENVYARMTDSFGNETLRFELDECYSNVTAMVLGELYRYKEKWKFNAVGSGVAKNLADFCGMYGVNLTD